MGGQTPTRERAGRVLVQDRGACPLNSRLFSRRVAAVRSEGPSSRAKGEPACCGGALGRATIAGDEKISVVGDLGLGPAREREKRRSGELRGRGSRAARSLDALRWGARKGLNRGRKGGGGFRKLGPRTGERSWVVGRSGAACAGAVACSETKGLRRKEGKREEWGERRGGWPVGGGAGK